MSNTKTLKPWEPGQSGNPAGRPVGDRNKLATKFISDLYASWLEDGTAVIEEVRQTNPSHYLRVIAKVLPRELHVKTEGALQGLTDEQLDEMLRSVRGVISARSGTDAGAGEQPPSSADKLN